MSGSGATCFALFSDLRSAAARRRFAAEYPEWWVEARLTKSITTLTSEAIRVAPIFHRQR